MKKTDMIPLDIKKFSEMLNKRYYNTTIRYNDKVYKRVEMEDGTFKDVIDTAKTAYKKKMNAKEWDGQPIGIFNKFCNIGTEAPYNEKITKDSISLKDIAQSVVLRILENINDYEVVNNDEDTLVSFLQRMLNLASKRMKRPDLAMSLVSDYIEDKVGFDAADEVTTTNETFAFAEMLEPKYSKVLIAFAEFKTITEAAKEVGITRKTFIKRLDEGKKLLEKAILSDSKYKYTSSYYE